MGIRSRIANLFRRPDAQGPRVLLYHRVVETARDPQLLCVTPETFAAQMEWLSRNCTVLAMPTALELSWKGLLPRNAVVVTFDDGYFDNLAIAGPVLEMYEIPAAIYVSSGFVDSGREMWWDDLERMLLGNTSLPDTLVLTLGATNFEWDLRGDIRDDTWNVTLAPSTRSQDAYLTISRTLKYMRPDEREDVLRQVRRQTHSTPEARDTHRGVSRSELRNIDPGGLIHVGGHTVDHVALSAMSPVQQRLQIKGDKSSLEAILGASLSGFAYPYGTATEYDSSVVTAVRDAGYVYACANIPGVLTHDMPAFEIPRQIVRNWGVHKFAGVMRQWLG